MCLRRLAAAWIAAALSLSAQHAAHVRENVLTLTTYAESAPDPDPQFHAFNGGEFPLYPYSLRSTLQSQTPHPAAWRTIVLENEYLSCRILPDLGGHLHGCTDKIAGREIFYANPAVRRGHEDFRGTFVAMGIESSFPVAHSRVGGSPVDFGYSEADGIARAVVEDTDRVTGMEWRVEYILRPDSTVLEQRVTLHNATASRHGYHWWANAAIELDDPDLRFVYPVKWMLPHGPGGMTSWPVNAAGVDLSRVANHKTNLGLFGHGSREPWMAVFKPALHCGIAHYADPAGVPGKKLWLWGSSDRYVKSSLTDNFNSYVEMQAGLFETQPEFAFLLPGEIRTFSHYWIPFHGLSGVSRVTRDAVLNVARGARGVSIELNATHVMPGARIRLLDGSRTLEEIAADLDPKTVYTHALDPAPARLTLELVDASGAVVLRHVEGEYDALPFDAGAPNPEPADPRSGFDSEALVLTRGAFNEQRNRFDNAWHDYQGGLEKFPGSTALAKAAGRTAFALNRFDDSIRLLAPLVEHEPSDTEAAYYYGVAAAASGRAPVARTALLSAARDPRWAPAARLQLALLAARSGDLAGAARGIQTLAADAGAAVRTGAFEIAILRRAGKADAAKQRLQFWRRIDPADTMLRFEDVLLGGADAPSLWNHLAADPQRVLNLAVLYLQLGAYDDALKLMDRRYPTAPASQTVPDAVALQDNPLVAYYRGWCRLKLGQSAAADFQAASALSTRYIFPNRASSIAVLQAALEENGSDATAHDLLGDLYFNSVETTRAIGEWRKALELKPDLPALHYKLGRALLDIAKDPAAATPILLEGARLDPGDRGIADTLRRMGRTRSAAAKQQ